MTSDIVWFAGSRVRPSPAWTSILNERFAGHVHSRDLERRKPPLPWSKICVKGLKAITLNLLCWHEHQRSFARMHALLIFQFVLVWSATSSHLLDCLNPLCLLPNHGSTKRSVEGLHQLMQHSDIQLKCLCCLQHNCCRNNCCSCHSLCCHSALLLRDDSKRESDAGTPT